MILCLKKHHVAHVLSFSSKKMVQFVVPLRSRHLVTLLRRQWKTVASNGSYCRICKRLVAKGWGCGFFELLTVCTVESWWKLLKWVGLEDGDVQQNPNWLVVWTPLKNISHLGWLFPIYGKIKNVPNHQPAMKFVIIFHLNTFIMMVQSPFQSERHTQLSLSPLEISPSHGQRTVEDLPWFSYIVRPIT